jgi:hypothetical protein
VTLVTIVIHLILVSPFSTSGSPSSCCRLRTPGKWPSCSPTAPRPTSKSRNSCAMTGKRHNGPKFVVNARSIVRCSRASPSPYVLYALRAAIPPYLSAKPGMAAHKKALLTEIIYGLYLIDLIKSQNKRMSAHSGRIRRWRRVCAPRSRPSPSTRGGGRDTFAQVRVLIRRRFLFELKILSYSLNPWVQRRTAWGVQKGRRRPQATRPAGRKRVRHGGPW